MRPGSAAARAFVGMQYLLPQHLLSRAVRGFTRWRWRGFSQPLIRTFIRGFRPDLSDALQPDPHRYDSFNEFFVRVLRPGARPMPTEADAIASPVDGTISALGDCSEDRLLQAKGRDYSLATLLAQRGDWPRYFAGGRFMTTYLAPSNYHRIHMPLRGRLVDAWYVPGRLFSVNAVTAAHVPNLFARNERLVMVFEDQRGCFAVVLVGALFVGSMGTVWHGDVVPRQRGAITGLTVPPAAAAWLERGAEVGRFNMGSTVIVLLPRGAGHWRASLQAGQTVRVGDNIGSRGP